MTLEQVRKKALEPRPEPSGQHQGPPEGWAPPPIPEEMEAACEAAIGATVRAEGERLTIKSGGACGGSAAGLTVTGMAVQAEQDNTSCVYARAGARLLVENCVLNKSGGAYVRQVKTAEGDVELPMLRGINSAVLSNGPDTVIRVSDTSILSECEPGNMGLEASHGAFSVFRGETWLKNVTISLKGGFAHGVYDTLFGVIYLDGCWVETWGHCASALATDNPGGDIHAKNVAALTHGPASAGIYADGGSTVTFLDGYLRSEADAGAIVCNDGVVKIKNTVVMGQYAARMWQPVDRPGTFLFEDCTLAATENAAFVFDGGYGSATFDNCKIIAPAGKCLVVSRRCFNNYDAVGRGQVTVRNSQLTGDIGCVDDCSLSLALENASITGAVYNAGLTLDFGSSYVFTGDSRLSFLKAPSLDCLRAVSPCVITYDPAVSDFEGTHTIQGGARLVPVGGRL